jgi:hypothetical protein
MIQYHRSRKAKAEKYKTFRKEHLNLTQRYLESNQLYFINDDFDAFIAGSDQIWNTTKKTDMSDAYFLAFADEKKLKIAYAVSIGEAMTNDLSKFADYIKCFGYISSRENRGASVIRSIVDTEIPVMLDPTLLVKRTVLTEITQNYLLGEKKYILYYTLDGHDNRNKNVDILKELSNILQLPVIVIAPEWSKKGFRNIFDAGPGEFLWLIQNAALVCTNSFHGTALSIALEKQFFVLEKYDGKDDRKLTILSRLGLTSRMFANVADVAEKLKDEIDYNHVNKLLERERQLSLDFLQRALGEEM